MSGRINHALAALAASVALAKKRVFIKRKLRRAGVEIPDEIMTDLRKLRQLAKEKGLL